MSDPRIQEVEAILAENARLLGQEQDCFLRVMPSGVYRVQVKIAGRWQRGQFKNYSTIESLRWAADVANRRAHEKAVR